MKVIMELDLLIMVEISKNLKMKWSINKLSKTLNKHYKPVYMAVQRLIREEFLLKNSNGLIEPTFKNTLLLELAEKKRMTDLKNKTIKIIKKKLEEIENSFFSAVLFGSSVYKHGKDIDLLMILPDSYDTSRLENIVKKTLGSFFSKIDLNIVNEASCFEMLDKPNRINVMNEILKNHLTLIGTENFYRILKRWKNAD